VNGRRLEHDDLIRLSIELSERFGYRNQYETNITIDKSVPKSCWPPYNGPHGISLRYRPGTRKGPRHGKVKLEQTPYHLSWAFFHRFGEKPYSEEIPSKKSVSLFCRNASDRCIPCTFLCRGCENGDIRISASGITPYNLDSEIIGEAIVGCLESVFSTNLQIDYAKKGIIWNGYIPKAVRHYSGPWLNMAMLDYLHKNSGVLSDFEYPFNDRKWEQDNTKEPDNMTRKHT
jgi:hypothetical protein